MRKSVNPEHLHIVYDWLAFKAKHSEKMAFLDTMIFARDFMATIGEKAVQSTMEDLGEGNRAPRRTRCPRRRPSSPSPWRTNSAGAKTRAAAGTTAARGAVDGDGMRKGVEEKRLMEERAKAAGKNGAKLRHGHGVGSKYRSEEERLNDADAEYEGERQVAAFEQSFERKMR